MSKSAELLPGTLEMLILKTLSIESMHGYGIAQHIQMLSADVLTIEEGSLYPALQRMLRKGWIRSEWRVTENNRRARYYELTASGRRQLGERTGLTDPALIAELEALGFTPDTVALLPLVPVVQVAWAEGGVSTKERALVADFVPAERRGTAFGWFHLTVGIGMLPASVVFGLVWDAYGPRNAFLLGAGLALAAAVLLTAVPGPERARRA